MIRHSWSGLGSACLSLCLIGCGGGTTPPPKVAVVQPQRPAQDIAFEKGVAHAEGGQWEAAESAFEQALQSDRSMFLAHLNLGLAREHLGDDRAALRAYVHAHDANPGDFRANLAAARVCTRLEMLGDAEKWLRGVPEEDSHFLTALVQLADVQRRAKRFEQARSTIHQALLREPEHLEARKTLARLQRDQGYVTLATAIFEMLRKEHPKDVELVNELGFMAYRAGRHGEALRYFESALEIAPQDPIARLNAGSIALSYRDYDRAEQHLSTSVPPALATCLRERAYGYALEGQRKAKEAMEQLEKAHEACPDDSEILFALGELCMTQLGDQSCALEHFERFTHQQSASTERKAHVQQMVDSIRAQLAMMNEASGQKNVEDAASMSGDVPDGGTREAVGGEG